MTKKYGTTDLSSYSENLKKDQAERRGKLKKLFSGPLFPKGTGGLFPKYDEALKKKQASVEVEMPKAKPKSFDEAFKMAKGQKTFTYKGKSYARVTKDEMKKAGFKSLRAYLNAQKGTKGTKIARRP